MTALVHRTARLVARVFFTAGVMALGCAAYIVFDAKTYQAMERRRFAEARRRAPAAVAAEVIDGGAIGEIRIPRLGLRAIVAQGESDPVLRRGVGHLVETALPGEPGNVVLAGHRDTFFRPLKHVRAGDAIMLSTRAGDIEYVVESTSVVRPGDLRPIAPTARRSLTLITCFPFSYIGPAPDRFIVRAREREGHR